MRIHYKVQGDLKNQDMHEKNIFVKTLNVNIIFFWISRNWRKYHIVRKTKIKESIIFFL